jgi:mono/diheme cytochrome c family protein
LFEVIEHGRYMATAADCSACHTAKGGQPFAGGGALETPFGILLAPNITPELATGIGGWTDDEFINAVQNGIGHGGIHLYPAMPYPYYTKMTREDVIAIRAHLDTLEPVHNLVQANQLPFPFNQREAMVGWNALYFTHQASSNPIPASRRNGTAAPIWSTASNIAACATRRRTRWAVTRTAGRCRGPCCRTGLRRT